MKCCITFSNKSLVINPELYARPRVPDKAPRNMWSLKWTLGNTIAGGIVLPTRRYHTARSYKRPLFRTCAFADLFNSFLCNHFWRLLHCCSRGFIQVIYPRFICKHREFLEYLHQVVKKYLLCLLKEVALDKLQPSGVRRLRVGCLSMKSRNHSSSSTFSFSHLALSPLHMPIFTCFRCETTQNFCTV